MGADYYSMTCIGLKVPRNKIIKEEEKIVNLCGCNPQTRPGNYLNAKYCPVCGRLIRRVVKEDKLLFDVPEEYYNDGKSKILGWTLMYDTDVSNFYICIFASGIIGGARKSDIPDVSEEIIAKFTADMQSIGLWDEEQFGLWTVTYCSY